MLANSELVAFVTTRHPQKTRNFYEQTLALQFISEDPLAIVFNAHGVTLRVTNVSTVKDFKPHPFTVLGWRVASAADRVRELGKKGVRFERYPGMDQDSLGIWQSPSGAKVAWFKDPDGNVLSITEI